jgi:2-C-methyl-D-erythritol 4-phosphate cytidylyltransferase
VPTVALIVAAGQGERLGFGRPKALVTLGARTLLEWSLLALEEVRAVDRIAIAIPPGEEVDVTGDRVVTVPGGATRSHSVRAALRAVGEGDPVIVHDAARPLATAELFERALRALDDDRRSDGVIAATAVPDTIKEIGEDGRTVTHTLDRSRLWAVQTPQVFRRAALERALDVPDDVLAAATDDAWLVERVGGLVRVVEGDPTNIKITSPTDLRTAEMLLAQREER